LIEANLEAATGKPDGAARSQGGIADELVGENSCHGTIDIFVVAIHGAITHQG